MSALLKFKKGLYSALPTQKTEGTVYITTDEKAMYVDIDSTTRIRIGQIMTLTSEEWQQLPAPFSEDVFYYITNLNALIRWDESKQTWIQINSLKEVTDRLTTLETVVGTTEGTGLRAIVAAHTIAIENINNTVGNENSGLVHSIRDLNNRLSSLEEVSGQPNVIETITVGGTVVEITEPKTVALGKLAGVSARVALADLDEDVSNKLAAYELALDSKTSIKDFEEYKQEVTNTFNETTQSITSIRNILGEGFSATEGETVADIINAIVQVDTTQNQTLATYGETLESLETASQAHGLSIQSIQQSLNGKVDKTDYENRVGESGTLTALVNKGIADAKAAQDTADANIILINANAEAIEANRTSISTLRSLVDNTTNIMNFLGAVLSTDAIENPQPGDVVVVISTGKEFVYDSENGWVELGDASGNANAIKDLSEAVSDLTKRTETLETSAETTATTLEAHRVKINKNEEDIALLREYMTWGDFTTT